jgi:hypothetical protein
MKSWFSCLFNKIREASPSPPTGGVQIVASDPSFQTWAADTAVRDERGAPLVVYHASDIPVTSFWPLSHFGTQDAANDLAQKRGGRYDSETSRTIYPVYLDIKNPLRLPDTSNHGRETYKTLMAGILTPEEIDDVFQQPWQESFYDLQGMLADDVSSYAPDGGALSALFNQFKEYVADYESEIEELREGGLYDEYGLNPNNLWCQRLVNVLSAKGYDGLCYENQSEDKGSVSWVIFNSHQVRSAITGQPILRENCSPFEVRQYEETISRRDNYAYEASTSARHRSGSRTSPIYKDREKIAQGFVAALGNNA